jgi:sugar phosphate isomerase/epimerase
MKISVTPISLSKTFREGGMNLKSFIDYCSEQKLDGVDILDTKCYPWCWAGYEGKTKEIRALLDGSGLKLAAYATGNNFAKTDKAEFAGEVEKVKNALREASELNAPLLRIFGGYMSESGGADNIDYANGFELVIKGIEQCLPEAEKAGVPLALENHGRLPGHSYEIEKLIRRFDSPYLRVMFDCANFMAHNMDEPENPLMAWKRVGRFAIHAHVKDFGPAVNVEGARVQGYVAGKGDVPLRQLAALMEEDGFTGYCSLEYEASRMSPELDGVPESLAYLRRIRAIHEVL